jgi:hypothetical protein
MKSRFRTVDRPIGETDSTRGRQAHHVDTWVQFLVFIIQKRSVSGLVLNVWACLAFSIEVSGSQTSVIYEPPIQLWVYPSTDICTTQYEGVSKSFRTESMTKYTLTKTNTRWEATQMVMAAKLSRLTHKIAILLHLVAESCPICSSRSRRPVRKLLDTPSYTPSNSVPI